MGKQEALTTNIFDVPHMRQTNCRRLTKSFWRKGWWTEETGSPDDDRPLSDEEREDRIKNNPLTLEDIIQEFPWETPARPLVDFALKHGLTRVDWHVLPYDEDEVMSQLRGMRREDIVALPLLVFGFLSRASRWVHVACGTDYDKPTGATIAQFLDARRESIELSDRASTSFRHLVECLRTLGFTGDVLESGQIRLARSIRRKYGLSPKRAEQVVNIAIQEGWLDKIQLV